MKLLSIKQFNPRINTYIFPGQKMNASSILMFTFSQSMPGQLWRRAINPMEWASFTEGGSHIDMVYVYVPAFWGAISRNLV